MKSKDRTLVLMAGGCALLGFTLVRCGGGGSNEPAPAAPAPGVAATEGSGTINFGCTDPTTGQKKGQQQQQVQFQQQQQSGCQTDQGIQFFQKNVDDFDMNLDCSRRVVTVQSKGFESQQTVIPIQQDGTVKGKMQQQQILQTDGKSSQVCFVVFDLDFDGNAECDVTQPKALHVTTSVNMVKGGPPGVPGSEDAMDPFARLSPSPSPSPSPDPEGGFVLVPGPIPSIVDIPDSTPTVTPFPTPSAFFPTLTPEPSPTERPFISPTPEPSESASPSPSPSATETPFVPPTHSPSPSPSPTPSESPHPSPSPSMRPSPSPIPTVTVFPTPVIVCQVVNPCPVVAKSDMSCGQ